MSLKRTILLIEDNEDHAEIAQFYIQQYASDIDVVVLRDGGIAIEHILEVRKLSKQSYPWLILLDINLPKYDGHEILAKLKSDEVLIEAPVVVFTTSNSDKDVDRALKAGANSYIQKPTEPDEFGEVISKIIDYWSLNQHGLIIEGLNHHVDTK